MKRVVAAIFAGALMTSAVQAVRVSIAQIENQTQYKLKIFRNPREYSREMYLDPRTSYIASCEMKVNLLSLPVVSDPTRPWSLTSAGNISIVACTPDKQVESQPVEGVSVKMSAAEFMWTLNLAEEETLLQSDFLTRDHQSETNSLVSYDITSEAYDLLSEGWETIVLKLYVADDRSIKGEVLRLADFVEGKKALQGACDAVKEIN